LKGILFAAAFFGLSAVVLGAFGAHALREMLSESALATYETAVKYQMWHALAMLFVFLVTFQSSQPLFRWAAVCFGVGIVLFSGSLYLLAFGAPRWLGPVTPLGGLSFIAGWCLLMGAAFKLKV